MGKRFEETEVWQKAQSFCKTVFSHIRKPEFAKDFELKNQINRSSGSIMDNIAEGYERNNNKEFIHFLLIAKGSCGESRSQLYRAHDRSYISDTEFEEAISECEEISKQLNNFINYLKQSEFKGAKHVSIERHSNNSGKV